MADPTRPPPSTAAIAVATGIISLLFGFFLGQGASLGLFSLASPLTPTPVPLPRPLSDDSDSTSLEDSSDDDDTHPKHAAELRAFPSHKHEEHKLVLVVRADLGMTKGKIAAQCSHATLACYKTLLSSPTASTSSLSPGRTILQNWERQGQSKIALQVKSEDELLELQARALSLGLCARVVHDAGRTQISAGSATVLGIGPGPKGVVDEVSGGLKLL